MGLIDTAHSHSHTCSLLRLVLSISQIGDRNDNLFGLKYTAGTEGNHLLTMQDYIEQNLEVLNEDIDIANKSSKPHDIYMLRSEGNPSPW